MQLLLGALHVQREQMGGDGGGMDGRLERMARCSSSSAIPIGIRSSSCTGLSPTCVLRRLRQQH